MIKPFLILQLRPEDVAADDEFMAFVEGGGLSAGQVRRLRMEKGDLPDINLDEFSAVIVGGGPYNVSDPLEKRSRTQRKFEAWLEPLLAQIIERDFPYLGACYGLGILVRMLGAQVSKDRYSEPVKPVEISLSPAGLTDKLLEGLPEKFYAFAGHKEAAQFVPIGAELLGSSRACPVHIIRVKQNIYATQFHPEANNQVWERRIRAYEHAGYFDPAEMEDLIKLANNHSVSLPVQILRRFCRQYAADFEISAAGA